MSTTNLYFAVLTKAAALFGLLATTGTAAAQVYVVSYSSPSGHFHVTGGNGTYDAPYAGGTGGMGGTGVSGTHPGGGGQGGPGTVGASGQITATATIVGGPINVLTVPPAVLVKETCTVTWAGDAGSCANGLGNTAVPPSGGGVYAQTSTGVRWSLKRNPGASFTVSCTPVGSAESWIGGPSGVAAATVSVNYEVKVFPVTMQITGTQRIGKNDTLLIGQELGASIDLGGAPATTGDSYTWGAGGSASPFGDYYHNADYSLRYYTPFVGASQPSASLYYANVGTGSVLCTVHLALVGEDLTLAKQISTIGPSLNFKQAIGTPLIESSGNGAIGIIRLWNAVLGLDNGASTPVAGVLWAGRVTTPQAFSSVSDTGKWGMVQVATVNRTIVRNSITLQLYEEVSPGGQLVPINGVRGLDTSYPYAPEAPEIWYANNTEYYSGDSPSSGGNANFGDTIAAVSDSFELYYLYQPPGLNSHSVPIRRLDWSWAAWETFDGYIWNLAPYNPPSFGNSQISGIFDQPNWNFSIHYPFYFLP